MKKKLSSIFKKVFLVLLIITGVLVLFKNVTYSSYKPEHTIKELETSLKERGVSLGTALFIRIFKETSELEVWLKDKKGSYILYKTYPICYYSGELGPKLKEGDKQAPEGFYHVTKSQMNPNSRYHLSFNLGYPNLYDQAHNRTGSYLMVHGSCVSIGCYAMTDKKIEEIYTLADLALKNGQSFFSVHIFPFRMTDSNMKHHEKSKWYPFWKNLKEGYDVFEINRHVPNITVKEKQYIITQ